MKEKKKDDQMTPTYFTYKDRVFRFLFKDRKRLLELYNALNGTSYENEEDLLINTLENAIYIKMKNDISFVIDCNMCLYEHQSTFCPNMPLRGFLYFADLYKKLTRNIDLSISRQIKIPTPCYVVFYNGAEKTEEEYILKLSDAFADGKNGCIEVTVRVINVNFGKNKNLLEKSPTLYEYTYFVDIVRRNLRIMERECAIEKAVEECIEKGILKEFLLEQKSEVIAMSIYEYNEEYVRKVLHEDGMLEGMAVGKIEGKAEAILEFLEEKGSVPDHLKEEIRSVKDEDKLRKMIKSTATVESVEEFAEALKTY